MGSLAWKGAIRLALSLSLLCCGGAAASSTVEGPPPGKTFPGPTSPPSQPTSRTSTTTSRVPAPPPAEGPTTSIPGCAVVSDADVSGTLKVPVTRHSTGANAELDQLCTAVFTTGEGAGQIKVFLVHEYGDLRLLNTPEKLKLNPGNAIEEWPLGLDAEVKLFVGKAGTDESPKTLMIRKNGRLVIIQALPKVGTQPYFTKAQLLDLGRRVISRM